MKKILFLAFVTLITTACPIVRQPPFPPGVDWSLDIVKFKNSEYKNFILAREGEFRVDTSGYTVYNKDTQLYRMEDPIMYDFRRPGMSLSPLYEKGIWIELANGYYLCYWRWQTLFSPYFLYGDGYSSQNWSNYWVYNCFKEVEIDNTLLLMRDEWNSLPDTIPYVSKCTSYREHGDYGSLIYYTEIIYGHLYSTTDTSRILKEYPIAEHYVVTAKSLFEFTHTDCDKTTKLFLGYDPRYNLEGLEREIFACTGQQFWIEVEKDKFVWNKLYPNTYDAISDKISDLLKSVIKSGRLQEYLEYDLEYNEVKKKCGEWQGL